MFNRLLYSLVICFLFVPLYAKELQKLPRIVNIGIVPLQWELSRPNNTDLIHAKEQLQQEYLHAVSETKKFNVINNELVNSLWSTAPGRSELNHQFELSGYLSLVVKEDGNLMRLNCRLLSIELVPLLMESEVRPKSEFLLSLEGNSYSPLVADLVARLLNRIPGDAFISSIQEHLLTISAGKNQNITLGEHFTVFRSFIKTLHPVLGTWEEFSLKPIGEIEIIDVKDLTSIGKIIKQNFPGAIEVGDAFTVRMMPSRKRFVQSENKIEFPSMKTKNNDLGSEKSANEEIAVKSDKSEKFPETPISNEKPVVPIVEKEGQTEQESKPISTSDSTEEKPGFFDRLVSSGKTVNNKVMGVIEYVFHRVDFYAGLRHWSVSKSAATGNHIFIPVNTLGAGAERNIGEKIVLWVGGDLMFGKTDKGSYTGANALARVFWSDQIVLFHSYPNYFKVGVLGGITGIGVTGEKFGGGDYIHSGVFGQLTENIVISSLTKPLETYYQIDLEPLSIGRFGVKGSNQSIRSSLGWRLAAGGYWPSEETQPWSFGGELSFSNYDFSLAGSGEIGLKSFTLMGLARYKF